MFRSIIFKVSVLLLSLFFLVGVMFVFISEYFLDRHMLEITQRLNRSVGTYIASKVLSKMPRPYDSETLRSVFDRVMLINPSVELYLISPVGEIVAYSAPTGKVVRKKIDLDPIDVYLSNQDNYPILGDDPRNLNRQKIFSVTEIREASDLKGYLYMILGGELLDNLRGSVHRKYGLWINISALVLSIVFGLLAGVLIYFFLTRRLKRVTSAIDDYKRAGFSTPLKLSSDRNLENGDEIDQLTVNLANMGSKMDEHLNAVTLADEERRRLVANISHDLRTPILSVRGHLETLLDRFSNVTSEVRQYIKSALKSSAQIQTLTDGMFELSKLEIDQSSDTPESFSLPELVQDVTQQFRLIAENKNLKIDLHLQEKVPDICADIALIDRALTNLIDNAVKHTPADGFIRIGVSDQGDEIRVEITNSGSPVNSEELDLIFEPLYRTGTSRNLNPDGTGLGLAIVKRILQRYGSTINAENLADETGIKFSFSLPAASAKSMSID